MPTPPRQCPLCAATRLLIQDADDSFVIFCRDCKALTKYTPHPLDDAIASGSLEVLVDPAGVAGVVANTEGPAAPAALFALDPIQTGEAPDAAAPLATATE